MDCHGEIYEIHRQNFVRNSQAFPDAHHTRHTSRHVRSADHYSHVRVVRVRCFPNWTKNVRPTMRGRLRGLGNTAARGEDGSGVSG